MIDANLSNFEAEVVEASHTLPVLVDLWAPWCGPCRSLGPVLEKLETAYAGRFKLVKINTEEEQDLAAAFGVRSIPMVVLLKGGQPVDGFVGALPESQIRQFLDKHVPPADENPAEPEPQTGDEQPASNDPEAVLQSLQQALEADPADDKAREAYVERLLRLGRAEQAHRAFEPLAPKIPLDSRVAALKQWLDAWEVAAAQPDDAPLSARIAADRRDFAARYALAQRRFAAARWTEAMDELLEILMRDKTWNQDAARRTYVAILELMAPPQPKPAEGQAPSTDPTVETYRRRLSMTVLS